MLYRLITPRRPAWDFDGLELDDEDDSDDLDDSDDEDEGFVFIDPSLSSR
jgi:hypothetical protein